MKLKLRPILTFFITVSLFVLSSQCTGIKAECGIIMYDQCQGPTGGISGKACWFGNLPDSVNQVCCESEDECVATCKTYNSYHPGNEISCSADVTEPEAPDAIEKYGESTADIGTITTDSAGTYCLDVVRKAITPFTDCSTPTSKICVRQGTSCPPRYTCDLSTNVCKEDANGTSISEYCCVGQDTAVPTATPRDKLDILCNSDNGIKTAIGCLNVFKDSSSFASQIIGWAIGIGGGIAFLLMLYAGFMIMTAQGNPERLKAGQELLTSAIAGVILLIFSVFILKFTGGDILGLCKFGFGICS